MPSILVPALSAIPELAAIPEVVSAAVLPELAVTASLAAIPELAATPELASIPAITGATSALSGALAPGDLQATLPDVVNTAAASAPDVSAAPLANAASISGALAGENISTAGTDLAGLVSGQAASEDLGSFNMKGFLNTLPKFPGLTADLQAPFPNTAGPTNVMGPSSVTPTPGQTPISPTAPSSVPISPTATGTLDSAQAVDPSAQFGTQSATSTGTVPNVAPPGNQIATVPTLSDSGTAPSTVTDTTSGDLSGGTDTGNLTGTTTPSTANTPSTATTATDTPSVNTGVNAADKVSSGITQAASDVTPSSGTDLLSDAGSLGKKAGDYLLKNPGLLLSGGGLLMDFLNQPTFPSVQSSINPLESQAAALNTQGTQLQQYLQTGTLPPGVQQGITQASEAAKAAIRSKYAAMGGGAETSSAAIQDLANVDMTAQTQGATIAMNLLQQGVSETQLSSQLYTELLNATLANDQALSGAIGNFATSLVPKTVVTVPATSSSA